MRFALYDTATGQILRVIICTAESAEASCMPGQQVVEALPDVMDNTHYVSNGSVVNMGDKPTKDHKWDWATKTWTADIAAAKQVARSKINAERDARETQGFPYLGKWFDSDQRSVLRINTVAAAATSAIMASQPFLIEWTCADNSVIELNASQMAGVPAAMAEYANQLHQTAKALKEQIDSATTLEQVHAVVWPDA